MGGEVPVGEAPLSSSVVAAAPGMTGFDVLVEVRLRPGIADPQGATVERALPALGFAKVGHVRVGKAVRFAVEAADEAGARQVASSLAASLLSNPVMEDTEVLWCRPSGSSDVGSSELRIER